MSTDEAWESWGREDPYYGVLTDPKFRAAVLTPEAKVEFFKLGRYHVAHVLQSCRQFVLPDFLPRRILDFGCGVGRLLPSFAEVAESVVGLDISESMLAEARRNCSALGACNVTLALSDDLMSAIHGQEFDLVHTFIVLQHLDVARGRSLFERLLDATRRGGIGVIHVTFAWDHYEDSYGQPVEPPPPPPPPPPSLWRDLVSAAGRIASRGGRVLRSDPSVPVARTVPVGVAPPDPEMQMNYYSMSELMFILQRRGVSAFHTELTDHGGVIGALLFYRKPA